MQKAGFLTTRLNSFEAVKQVQEKINIVLVEAGGQNVNLDSHQVILGYTDGSKELKSFVNFCLAVTKWELWKIRNIIKFENQRYTANEISKLIIQKIKGATKFIGMTKVYKRNEKALNMLNEFDKPTHISE